MKKKFALFMAVVCLVFCGGNLIAQAEEYLYCPYCGSALASRGGHLDHWTIERVFKDNNGASVTCYEYHSVDQYARMCEKGHGVVWSETRETVTHSLSSCPYK